MPVGSWCSQHRHNWVLARASGPLALALCVCAQAPVDDGPPLNLELGLAGVPLTDDDLINHERISRWFGEAYHSELRFDPEKWTHVAEELGQLAAASEAFPALAFAAGSALYSYFWWAEGDGPAVNVAAGQRAAALVERSIGHRSCDNASLGPSDFLARSCHMRWRQLMLLSAETARHLVVDVWDLRQGAWALQETSRRFNTMKGLPFFRQFEALGAVLRRPHDMNFNMDYYPHVHVGPIWPAAAVPLSSFLEEHFEDFRRDLLGIMDPATFWRLHTQAFVSETQFTPRDEDWQTVYLYVNSKWVDKNCAAAPRSCELLRGRPELVGCRATSAGAGFLRLRPGARLKPHYGNGPRLSAHLGLVVPEAGDIHMQVGTATVRWTEGRVVIFDDTFIHRVTHDGDAPRFVLLLWFCHPCDSDNWDNPPERQPEVCRWPR
mmetsp:Transcript_61682/g.198720  ORF Transcript_61682/g.198720 Transcript_61682/m.198720 type:complete len:436 (-) Transcript_61682:59-1366(-)